jgi:hypothetical protein
LVVTGLLWRREVCQQVFEEAAVDLGNGLAAWSDSRSGKRKGKRVGFPRFKKKIGEGASFRSPDPQAGGRATNACGGTGAGHRTRGGATGPAIPSGKKQEPIGVVPNRQPDWTPEKGAVEQPGRSFDRL